MKILTANRLSDGVAVWLKADHSWSETIHGADLARDSGSEDKLTLAGKAALHKHEVVDVNLIDIDLVDGVIVPRRLRERIRASGPTIAVNTGFAAGAQRRAA